MENGIDLVMVREKPFGLSWGLEPSHYFLSFSRGPMVPFNSVIDPLVRTVVCIWGQLGDWLYITA